MTLLVVKGLGMSSSYPPGSGSAQSPYGHGQQSGYTGPPTSASGSGGAVVMIVIALGVVILLGLACAGAAVGFLFFARASQSVARMEAQEEVMRMDAMAAQSEMEAPPPLEVSVPPASFLPTDPQRARWSYPTSPEGASGSILQQDVGTWVETRSDNLTMRFTEVARTNEYVDLYDAQRQLSVRLLADHMEWKREGQEWFRGQDGSWDAPSPSPPPTTIESPPPTSSDSPPPPNIGPQQP
jgi:hypothetical protein